MATVSNSKNNLGLFLVIFIGDENLSSYMGMMFF